MENSSNKEPTPGKLAGLNLYILDFALLATLVAGVAAWVAHQSACSKQITRL
jgi:hypothetical protein